MQFRQQWPKNPCQAFGDPVGAGGVGMRGVRNSWVLLFKPGCVSYLSVSPGSAGATKIWVHETMHDYKQALNDPKRYSARKHAIPVNFYCNAPEARQVSVVGEFNQWNSATHPMSQMPDGGWHCQIVLQHGHHQYLFQVDGQGQLDPRAAGVSRNEKNERVSLIFVS